MQKKKTNRNKTLLFSRERYNDNNKLKCEFRTFRDTNHLPSARSLMDIWPFSWCRPYAMAGMPWKKGGKKGTKEREKPSRGSCNRKLLLATICSSTRFFFFHLYANPESPHWKTGQVPLMSNLFQSSRVWAWQFTERLEELVITSVTGQLMHITLQHSWRWLSAPQ